jgi:hypothetical protein
MLEAMCYLDDLDGFAQVILLWVLLHRHVITALLHWWRVGCAYDHTIYTSALLGPPQDVDKGVIGVCRGFSGDRTPRSPLIALSG